MGSEMPVTSFIILTMIGSALIGGLGLGIVGAIARADMSLIIEVPSEVIFGSLFMIPFWFAIWGLPSALIFRCVKERSLCRLKPEASVRLAGFVTATVAAVIFTAVNVADRDIGWASLAVGLAAIVIAPSVASRTHRAT